MNIPITQIFSIVMLTLLLQASLSSCSGHDEPNLPKVTPQIVFLFSPGGLGDMSYNDCILEGVQHFKKENPGVDLLTSSLRTPKIFIKEFGDFLMSCHQHCLGVNLLVQR